MADQQYLRIDDEVIISIDVVLMIQVKEEENEVRFFFRSPVDFKGNSTVTHKIKFKYPDELTEYMEKLKKILKWEDLLGDEDE